MPAPVTVPELVDVLKATRARCFVFIGELEEMIAGLERLGLIAGTPSPNGHEPETLTEAEVDDKLREAGLDWLAEPEVEADYYTVEDVARLLAVSKDTVYRWLRAGTFPSPVSKVYPPMGQRGGQVWAIERAGFDAYLHEPAAR